MATVVLLLFRKRALLEDIQRVSTQELYGLDLDGASVECRIAGSTLAHTPQA